MRKRKVGRIVVTAVILVLLAAYIVFINVLVSAALVPSFMRKLDSFERISDETFSQMIQTDDITENHAASIRETREWLDEVPREKISETTEDGYFLTAMKFYHERKESADKWALVLHGYTGWKEEMYPFAKFYYELGYDVLVPDLRCQGESDGDFIGMGYTDAKDCMLWLDRILEEAPDAKIVLHGQSMGAATALIMTGRDDLVSNVCAVVSDCSYTDAYTMFGDKAGEWLHLPAFPLVDSVNLALQVRGGYDLRKASALDAVRRSDTPTLFIHGEDDVFISPEHTKKLYEAAPCEKRLLLVPGAGHAQSQDKDPSVYYGTIEEFLMSI